MVLLVPGFMAQLYEAVSTFKVSRLSAEVRGELKKVPVIGDSLAAAMPAPHLPSLAPGTAISFYTQERRLEALRIPYVNIAHLSGTGFSTQQGVQANGQAIRAVLENLRARNVKRVVIVSHSNGGLDTLEALLTNEPLWNAPVVGWVALQAPFFGSPVAGPELPSLAASAPHREVLTALHRALTTHVPLAQALEDLSTAKRGPYMNQRRAAITRLASAIRVRSCYTQYQAAPGATVWTAASAVADFASTVMSRPLLEDIAAAVVTSEKKHLPNQAAATQEAVAESVKLVNHRLGGELQRVLRTVGLMDAFNLVMREPNDGLVPVASTRLPGAVVREILPLADHAAPVMLTAPFHEFWTKEHRDDQTLQFLAEVASAPRG
jgi:pimeloyl-ACP methyl ester carboxylesterase